MQETTFVLDRLRVVKIDAHIWGGRKKLRKEDLILADGSVLPPEDLASLGSKKIADPQELAVFNRLKKEAERICLKVGTRFLGGIAVPEGSVASIQAELERITSSFEIARDDFLSRYDQTIEDWVAKHPEFAPVIRRAVDPVDVVAAGLRFDYVIFRVSHPIADSDPGPEAKGGEETHASSLGDSLDRKVGSLSDTLFREIAQETNELLESSLLGRQSVTRKALSPFKRIRDKLDGLAFLDHRVHPVVETIDDLLARVPTTGPLEGAYLQEVFATALLLSDVQRIKRHGDGLLQVDELNRSMAEAIPEIESGEDSAAAENEGDATSAAGDDFWPDEVEPKTHESGANDTTETEKEPALPGDFWF
jgi:hypothetical protein